MSPERERQAERHLHSEVSGQARARKTFEGEWSRRGPAEPHPCQTCRAPDARQPDHARGCPKLPPVSREKLLRLIRETEDAWAQRRKAVNGAA